jgi:5'-methylthioadenosine phosphorylase
LAREAEICYGTVSLVTDYDVWKEGEEVTVEKVVETLHANVENVKKLVAHALPRLAALGPCKCQSALQYAVFTNPKVMPAKTKKKLALIIGKYVK